MSHSGIPLELTGANTAGKTATHKERTLSRLAEVKLQQLNFIFKIMYKLFLFISLHFPHYLFATANVILGLNLCVKFVCCAYVPAKCVCQNW